MSSSNKPKRLVLKVLSKELDLGEIDSAVHTDARSIVVWLTKIARTARCSTRWHRKQQGRKRRRGDDADISETTECENDRTPAVRGGTPRLISDIAKNCVGVRRLKMSDERGNLLAEAMKASHSCPCNSLLELEDLIGSFVESQLQTFNADTYYDARRAKGYTQANAEIQQRLTNRSLELLDKPSGLVLDLACGSGLSSSSVLEACSKQAPTFVVGTDAASAMLSTAQEQRKSGYVDFIQADMGQPMPFRSSVMDSLVSVSALHYLLDDQAKLETCVSEIYRVTDGKQAALQYFPNDEEKSPAMLKQAAMKAGWQSCALILDQTHHSSSYRWYMRLSSQQHKGTFCRMYEKPQVTCSLAVDTEAQHFPKDHVAYMKTEHCHFARRLLRCLKRDRSLLSDSHLKIASELVKALGLNAKSGFEVPSHEALSADFKAIDQVLHQEVEDNDNQAVMVPG